MLLIKNARVLPAGAKLLIHATLFVDQGQMNVALMPTVSLLLLIRNVFTILQAMVVVQMLMVLARTNAQPMIIVQAMNVQQLALVVIQAMAILIKILAR